MDELAPLIDVVDAKVLQGFEVELTFANGEVRTIDLSPFLWGPMFETIRDDYTQFLRFTVSSEAGTVVWPNGADLSPRTLYAESTLAVKATS